MDVRNSIGGFSERVLKNLDFMLEAHNEGREEVHIVTELATALMGLLIYPYEYYKDNEIVDFRKYTLERMADEQWPQWKFIQGARKPRNLRYLLRRVRNSAAHYGIEFSSESRKLDEVVFRFMDRPDEGEKEDWIVEIRGDQLLAFTQRLASLMRSELVS